MIDYDKLADYCRERYAAEDTRLAMRLKRKGVPSGLLDRATRRKRGIGRTKGG